MGSMDREKLYLQRAENELNLAKSLFRISDDADLKDELELKPATTFYSNVINACYYCVFYSAKAFLMKEGIKTEAPEEHRKTYEEFERCVSKGIIDVELLKIYKTISVRADELLGIFRTEKKKRGHFTYQKLPQANKIPAEESLRNAEIFFKNIFLIIGD
ncbi:MAG: hypothetical protein JW754_00965 [Candidatus Aenigmarchaeota archaeon]|nr:hypothetical protein [Candidatus Aenigmarchaeota archaeon]